MLSKKVTGAGRDIDAVAVDRNAERMAWRRNAREDRGVSDGRRSGHIGECGRESQHKPDCSNAEPKQANRPPSGWSMSAEELAEHGRSRIAWHGHHHLSFCSWRRATAY